MSARPRRIVVGYDGSAAAGRALDAAADLVGYGSTLAVVTLGQASPGQAASDTARERLLGRRVEARYLALGAEPAEQLVDKARELEADLLVVDSTCAGAVRGAPCDVLLVR